MSAKPRKGSTVWLMVCETSTNLQRMADALNPRYIRGEIYFAAAVRHVIAFGGVSATEIAQQAGRSSPEVEQWAKDDHLPSPAFRKKVLYLLQEMVRKRADEILDTIKSPPKVRHE